MSTRDFTDVINERHSVRKYDPSAELSAEEITELLEDAAKAPSSWNLQHWKFLVFHDQQAKEQLLPIAYNQEQVVQASAVVAILGDLEADQNADRVYQDAVDGGFMTEEIKTALVSQIKDAYATRPEMARDEAIRNASLASMQLMLTAKAKELDTCAMGGFNADELVKAFGIPERYLPVMLISVGKAAKTAHQTARFPIQEAIVWNKF
ncbi:nitroreductase family protein [Fictibacillus sp. KIGAM418]|uniref:Nitroreductase family protein n=1 Tax=Fictibacillus marinisediminis TaxID=2878389 RepID=A0A9X1XAC4_9BACL|nr:nitroreductase family protein [Fictibacillus marinisediminis]MCK6256145.1 nitroreductase family protein [Fictibacillus marinisediminis]